jgi:hypothetical protein
MNESEKIHKLFEKLVLSKDHIFPPIGKVNVSTNHGVYIIYSPKMKILHVGKTTTAIGGLNQRLLNHVRNQSSFSKNYLIPNSLNLRHGHKFKFIEVENARTRSLLEALTAGILCPEHIGTGQKKATT